MKAILGLFLLPAFAFASSGGFPDCGESGETGFGPVSEFNATWEGKPIVGIVPHFSSSDKLFPLVAFMHGSTGQIEMYREVLHMYAASGFIVLFPYIKSPKEDKNPLTTNTNGEYILHAIEYAKDAAKNISSPLFGRVDVNNIVVAGHSMGATCSIMAGSRLDAGSVKVVITQHPGICGPFGPPPWPATWMKSTLEKVQQKFPVFFTTATNDGAFWPAPLTAKHELGCFNGAVKNGTNPATFIQFSADACNEDGAAAPFTDSGHNCPFKTNVETPWVLAMMKAYAHFDGSMETKCAKMIFGNTTNSVAQSKHVELVVYDSRP